MLPITVLVAASFYSSYSYCQVSRAGGDKSASRNEGGQVERGRYIVENIAICAQCHTPRDDQGNVERNHWLEGAAVWLLPAQPSENWPLNAPRIAGTPPGTDAEMVTLLTTGLWRDGRYLRPPMPQFRMNRQDAESVVAYLKSLRPMQR